MTGVDDAGTTTSRASVSSLLSGPARLVMIASDGPALVCADGVCAPADDETDAGTAP